MFSAAEEIHLLRSHTRTASFSNKKKTILTDKDIEKIIIILRACVMQQLLMWTGDLIPW